MFEQENLVSLCHQLDEIAMAASTDTEKGMVITLNKH